MYKWFINLWPVLIFAACLMSCSSANNKPLSVGFSLDSSAIVFSDIHPAGLLQIRSIPGIDTAYNELLSVTEVPDDKVVIAYERNVPGKLHITDTSIVFHPFSPFVRGKSYGVMSYLNAKFGDPAMVFSGKMNYGVRSARYILRR